MNHKALIQRKDENSSESKTVKRSWGKHEHNAEHVRPGLLTDPPLVCGAIRGLYQRSWIWVVNKQKTVQEVLSKWRTKDRWSKSSHLSAHLKKKKKKNDFKVVSGVPCGYLCICKAHFKNRSYKVRHRTFSDLKCWFASQIETLNHQRTRDQ